MYIIVVQNARLFLLEYSHSQHLFRQNFIINIYIAYTYIILRILKLRRKMVRRKIP